MKRVLVVDDSALVRESIIDILSAYAGVETRESENGAAAIDIIMAWRPHCIFLDAHMPGLTGNVVARMVRGNAATRGTTIICISGSAGADAIVKELHRHSDFIMRKPFELRQMQDLFEKACLDNGQER